MEPEGCFSEVTLTAATALLDSPYLFREWVGVWEWQFGQRNLRFPFRLSRGLPFR